MNLILFSMRRIKYSIIQAATIVLIGMAVAFIHNAFSANGINPFRRIAEVPIVEDLTSDESNGLMFVDLERFREVILSGAVIIDSRTVVEYEEGHIPGAVLLDYYEFGRHMEEVIPLLDFEEAFVIYCAGPLCEDSEMLARELFTLGYKKILVFRGGMEEWEEAGLPFEKGTE